MECEHAKICTSFNHACHVEFCERIKNVQFEGHLIVIDDNKLMHNDMIGKWEKAGHYVNDTGGMVTQIKEMIKNVLFHEIETHN